MSKRTYQERVSSRHRRLAGDEASETRARETMAPLAVSLWWSAGRRRPPASLGGARLAKARAGPVGPAGPTSLGPAPPGAPFPRFEGDGKKGKGRARQPEK